MVSTVVVLAGGPDPLSFQSLPPGATVIAADSGADHAAALNMKVDILVGDCDSVSSEALDRIKHVERHPVAKDATDLELALAAAVRLEPKRILVVAGVGGRLDHLLGSLLLLASEALTGIQVDGLIGAACVHVVRGERSLQGEPGDLISLFAMHGAAEGVVTDGLVYPLRGETLVASSTRGVSNVFAAPTARIALERGVLLAVRPKNNAAAENERRPHSPRVPAS